MKLGPSTAPTRQRESHEDLHGSVETQVVPRGHVRRLLWRAGSRRSGFNCNRNPGGCLSLLPAGPVLGKRSCKLIVARILYDLDRNLSTL